MRNTTTVVIAAGAVLAAVIVTRTPAQQEGHLFIGPNGGTWYDHPDYENEVTPAREATGVGAAGGTCPSDVNNDGTVGINDFLQVLADWGACPNPRPIDVAVANITCGTMTVRLWSDGFMEYRAKKDLGACNVDNVNSWTPMPPIKNPPYSQVVAVSAAYGNGSSTRVHFIWADGTTYEIRYSVTTGTDSWSRSLRHRMKPTSKTGGFVREDLGLEDRSWCS